MLPRSYRQQRISRARGFSLIEIVVAMIIGLLSMIIIMQVLGVFQNQKQATSTGNDATTNGSIALNGLQRDLQQSGYGISTFNLLGCNVLLRTGVTVTGLAPVTIYPAGMASPPIPAGDANSDMLMVVYGNASGAVINDLFTGASTALAYPVQTPAAFTALDQVIGVPQARPAPCNLTLAQVSSTPASSVPVTGGVGGLFIGDTLANLGASPKIRIYAVRNGNLTMCDYTVSKCDDTSKASPLDSTVWVPVASNIVSLKAQYGRDTTPLGTKAFYLADTYDQTTPTTQCGWLRALAVRIALVARSAQPDTKSGYVPTPVAPTWAGTANPIVLTATPMPSANFTWQNYRYKVFQTIVPLRNITWNGVQPGC
ncbi:MAG: PilW family protein [Pseudomonadota bacterium]